MTKLSPFHTQQARNLVCVTWDIAVMVYLTPCCKVGHKWVQKCSAMMSQCQVETDQDKQSQPLQSCEQPSRSVHTSLSSSCIFLSPSPNTSSELSHRGVEFPTHFFQTWRKSGQFSPQNSNTNGTQGRKPMLLEKQFSSLGVSYALPIFDVSEDLRHLRSALVNTLIRGTSWIGHHQKLRNRV